MKFFILQLGCQMNISDSERIKSVLTGLGFAETADEEEADLLGVVACSVRQKAIDKVYGRISKWNKWKKERSLITFVSGCVLPADREKFMDRFDILFSIQELPNLPDMLLQYGLVTPLSTHAAGVPMGGGADSYWMVQPSHGSDFEAFVPIQNGCDKFCTFCAVPYTRGREISRSSQRILAEVKELVDRGYKSITLLGQNVNSYGLDKKGEEISFAELLRQIGEYGKTSGRDFWVYFTSPHPRDMTEEVVQAIADYRCLAKQIHLPIQSGDDKLLMRMNRNHSVERYREVAHTIRRLLPGATLFTDIIVGFTGETEEQFEKTRAALKEFQYNMAYIAMYSPRPGAASSRWDDDIPQDEKKKRLHELTSELQAISHAYNKKMIGKSYRVLVDGTDRKEGFLSAKTEGKIIVRFESSDESLIGTFQDVEITSAAPMSVEGRLVAPAPETAGAGYAVTAAGATTTGVTTTGATTTGATRRA